MEHTREYIDLAKELAQEYNNLVLDMLIAPVCEYINSGWEHTHEYNNLAWEHAHEGKFPKNYDRAYGSVVIHFADPWYSNCYITYINI